MRDYGHEAPPPLLELDAFLAGREVSPALSLVILGEVQDPHNVGAIIRSAAAFGASGVLIPERRQAPITPVVLSASAGAAWDIPLVSVGNVNQAIRTLKERGFWTYGLAGDGANPLGKERFDAPAAFVLGNEGEGLREKTREHCDIVLSIPQSTRVESLNVSNAAAVALYAWSAQHPEALRPELARCSSAQRP